MSRGAGWNPLVLLRCLKHRQRKYAEGLIRGQTKMAAALAAGYSRSTARNAALVIERPVVRFVLSEIFKKTQPKPTADAQAKGTKRN